MAAVPMGATSTAGFTATRTSATSRCGISRRTDHERGDEMVTRRKEALVTATRDDDDGIIRIEALDVDPTIPRWVSLELNFDAARELRDEIDRLLNLKSRIPAKLCTEDK